MWLLESLNTARQMAREASWGPGCEFHWGYKGKENGKSRDYMGVIRALCRVMYFEEFGFRVGVLGCKVCVLSH